MSVSVLQSFFSNCCLDNLVGLVDKGLGKSMMVRLSVASSAAPDLYCVNNMMKRWFLLKRINLLAKKSTPQF